MVNVGRSEEGPKRAKLKTTFDLAYLLCDKNSSCPRLLKVTSHCTLASAWLVRHYMPELVFVLDIDILKPASPMLAPWLELERLNIDN
jgi:hypothetical protein